MADPRVERIAPLLQEALEVETYGDQSAEARELAARVLKVANVRIDPHRENQAMTNDALVAAAKALIEEWKRYANDPDLTTPHWVTPYLRALNDALQLPDERGTNGN